MPERLRVQTDRGCSETGRFVPESECHRQSSGDTHTLLVHRGPVGPQSIGPRIRHERSDPGADDPLTNYGYFDRVITLRDIFEAG